MWEAFEKAARSLPASAAKQQRQRCSEKQICCQIVPKLSTTSVDERARHREARNASTVCPTTHNTRSLVLTGDLRCARMQADSGTSNLPVRSSRSRSSVAALSCFASSIRVEPERASAELYPRLNMAKAAAFPARLSSIRAIASRAGIMFLPPEACPKMRSYASIVACRQMAPRLWNSRSGLPSSSSLTNGLKARTAAMRS